MTLYRFELAFDGEPQKIGIMRGLDDIELPGGVAVNIEEDFNALPCPHISEDASFWFTEQGLQTFRFTLDYLAEHSRKVNWQLLYAKMPEADTSAALYADELQVAFPAKLVENMRPQYKEFRTVDTMLKELEELQ